MLIFFRVMKGIKVGWDSVAQVLAHKNRAKKCSLMSIPKASCSTENSNLNQWFLELTNMKDLTFWEVRIATLHFPGKLFQSSFAVIYNKYIEPRGLMHNASFLTHDFLPVMLNALGLDDKSGVIYEVVEHDYFNITDLGDWDKMMPGMINVMQFHLLSSSCAN